LIIQIRLQCNHYSIQLQYEIQTIVRKECFGTQYDKLSSTSLRQRIEFPPSVRLVP